MRMQCTASGCIYGCACAFMYAPHGKVCWPSNVTGETGCMNGGGKYCLGKLIEILIEAIDCSPSII